MKNDELIAWLDDVEKYLYDSTRDTGIPADMDRHKIHRRCNCGMGNYQYFLAPPGVILGENLPVGWGLLEPQGKRVRVVVEAPLRRNVNKLAEISMLCSVIRRIGQQSPDGVNIRAYTYKPNDNPRATLNVAEED